MTLLKVCGVKHPETLAWIDGSVDYVGFVYSARGGARSISPREADSLASTLSKSRPVIVMHGLSPEALVEEALKLSSIGIVQIHDTYPPSVVAGVSLLLQAHGLRAAPVALWDDGGWLTGPCMLQRELASLGVQVEYLLVDRVKGAPPLPGSVAAEAALCSGRLGVAGGLDPGRVCRLGFKPFLVDVSSWPEYEPGRKDPGRVLELRRSVRGCLGLG
ncbi:MAG: hypothetical protein GSR78_02670 [Desulfurococcales archaeon]|nr:hypothetical protein [Desulfurococcales archaeon]